MSIGTLDEDVRRVVEPGHAAGRKRAENPGRVPAAGIRTGVLVAPVLPGSTDHGTHLEEVLEACAEEGIAWATVIVDIRPGIRPHFIPWVREAYPLLAAATSAAVRRPARTRREQLYARARRALSPGCGSGTASRLGGPVPRVAPAERGQLALAV